eukprot:1185222-Prorocentrum_minimum.AAC.1
MPGNIALLDPWADSSGRSEDGKSTRKDDVPACGGQLQGSQRESDQREPRAVAALRAASGCAC